MAIYYLNAGSSIEDGLTAATGFHNLSNLLSSITLVDNDIIELVDNGTIDDSSSFIALTSIITLKSYAGNINKPTWKLPTGEGSFNIYYATTYIHIYDIRFLGTGSYSAIQLGSISSSNASEISRCHFDNVQVVFRDSDTALASITNNIFVNLSTSNNIGCVEFHPLSQITVCVNNNVFYQPVGAISGTYGIVAFGVIYGSFLNNIYYNVDICIYLSGIFDANVIDYSITYGWGTGEFVNVSMAYIGSHNISSTDPKFINPSGDDFTLFYGSPCLLSGIGYDIQPSVSLIDYNGEPRNNSTTNIGAYETRVGVDDSYSKIILHFNGPDGSVNFIDESGKLWTPYGNAQLSNSYKKFGAASGTFDGSGSYITTPLNTDFIFGVNDFTIDMWVRLSAMPGTNSIMALCATGKYNTSPYGGWEFSLKDYSGVVNLWFVVYDGSGFILGEVNEAPSIPFALNTWTHIAVLRSGSTLYFVKDGILGTGQPFSYDAQYIGTDLSIGHNADRPEFNGYIDEFRLSNGIARWTSDFNTQIIEYKPSFPDRIWTEVRPAGEGSFRWYRIASDASGKNLIACDYNGGYTGTGRVYISNYSGYVWYQTYPDGDNDYGWGTVASDSNGLVLLAGNFQYPSGGKLYLSINGGASWTDTGLSSNSRWIGTAISSDGTHLIACSYEGALGGRVYISSNSGSTWSETQPVDNNGYNWISVASSSDGSILLAAINYGRIYKSTTSGLSWNEIQPAGNSDVGWCSVVMSSDGSILIAVAYSHVYISSDGGTTWIDHAIGSGNFMLMATNSDCSQIFLMDNGHRLYLSSNLGSTWIETQPIGSVDADWGGIASNFVGTVLAAGVNEDRFYISSEITEPITTTTPSPTTTTTTTTPAPIVSYYANINNSYLDTGHEGTELDPFSFEDLLYYSSILSDVTFNIYGIRSLSTYLLINVSSNIWTSFNLEVNGPWRIGNTAETVYINSSSHSLIKNGIIYSAINIEFLGTTTANDTVFIALNDLVLNNLGLTFNACTLYGNLRK